MLRIENEEKAVWVQAKQCWRLGGRRRVWTKCVNLLTQTGPLKMCGVRSLRVCHQSQRVHNRKCVLQNWLWLNFKVSSLSVVANVCKLFCKIAQRVLQNKFSHLVGTLGCSPFTGLKELHAYGDSPKFWSSLSQLTSLTSLAVPTFSVVLNQLTNLTRLKITKESRTIKARNLSNLTNLNYLFLPRIDIEEFSGFKALRTLKAPETPMSGRLAEALPHLTSLRISSNGSQNGLSSLSVLTDLEKLTLSNSTSDPSVVTRLKKLRSVKTSGGFTCSFDLSLNTFPNLEALQLNQLTLPPRYTSQLATIRYVEFFATEMEELNLTVLVNLEKVIIRQTCPDKLVLPQSVTSLTYYNRNPSNLSALSNLKELAAKCHNFPDLSNLPNLTHLCSWSRKPQFHELGVLTLLKHLELPFGCVPISSGLSKLSKLISLRCQCNEDEELSLRVAVITK